MVFLKLFYYISFHEPLQIRFILFLEKRQPLHLHAIKWFISLNVLILDNPGWEMIYQRKSCIKCLKNVGYITPNKCHKSISNLE